MDSKIAAGYRRLVLAIRSWSQDTDDILPLRDCDIETIQIILSHLDYEFPDRSYGKILTMRFDLDGEGVRTFKTIGQQLGVSRERIRQKQIKALRLLRHPRRGLQLRMFFRSSLERDIEDLEEENKSLKAELAKERKHRMSKQLKARFGDVSPDEISIFDFEISVRLANCLRNGNINTLSQVLMMTERDFLVMKNFGRKSLYELKDILSEYGLSLAKQKL